eukprot:Gb_31628 [translate_table: standard]
MDMIQCVRVSCVKSAVPCRKHQMFLSAFDLDYFRPAHLMKVLIMYNTGNGDKEYHSMVERLKRSLSLSLVHFYPLAGRLVLGEDGRYAIDCNDAGAEFIEARTNISLSDMQDDDFDRATLFQKLVEAGKTSLCNDCNLPLVSIQVTRFAGGGLCVGLSINHVIVDGQSYWHFFKSWAELSRGVSISLLPIHNRTVFKVNKLELENRAAANITCIESLKSEWVEGSAVTNTAEETHQIRISDIHVCYKTFHFTSDMFHSLKRLAMGRGVEGAASNTFSAFSSHMWKCIMKAKGVAEEETVYFLFPVNCRSRINPALPPAFFGNCVHLAVAQARAGKLFSERISYGAALIAEAMNSVRDKTIKDFIKTAEGRGNSMDQTASALLNNGHLIVMTYSTSFSVYNIDFGWGRPAHVKSVRPALSSGLVVAMEGRDGGRNIDASIALPSDQMQRLQSILFCFED